MQALMLALLLHPEVFAKAQDEIDKLTKRERLVDFDDRDSLPYFECVMKEVFRFVLLSRYLLFVLSTDHRYFCFLMLNRVSADGRAPFHLVSASLRVSGPRRGSTSQFGPPR